MPTCERFSEWPARSTAVGLVTILKRFRGACIIESEEKRFVLTLTQRISCRVPGLLALIAAFCLWPGPSPMTMAAELEVDCAKTIGVIRPLHGANCGPLNGGGLVDLTAYHRELGIPLTRLHDCHWPTPDVVDLHVVFPDLRADPSRPESYDFERTDEYLQVVVNAGSGIVYRLGESIEHTKKKYHADPPADYDKWAAACLGIIRHYNEGWANGFRHKIRYWEVWNEPENRPNMWTGSDEDYFRLYATTAKAIKARFPEVLVGGPAVGNTGDMVGGTFKPSPFVTGFLDYCRRNRLPLDFFSWHVYSDDPGAFAIRARAVRELLDRYGFTKTESHLNEWNYLPGNDWTPIVLEGQGLKRRQCYEQIGGPQGAAFAACALSSLQDSPLDVANYYTAEIQGFGLFDFHGAPKKTFYAFKAFKMLLDTPVRVATAGGETGKLTVCAGTNQDRTRAGILVSHFRGADGKIDLRIRNLPWTGPTDYEILLVDGQRDLEPVRKGQLGADGLLQLEELQAPAVGLIRLKLGSQ